LVVTAFRISRSLQIVFLLFEYKPPLGCGMLHEQKLKRIARLTLPTKNARNLKNCSEQTYLYTKR